VNGDTDQGGRETSVAPAGGPAFVGTRGAGTQSLADVLERVLDKGIVIVGDIQIRLLDIELLTIKIRLMVASVERARDMGINWWEGDPFVTTSEDGDRDELLRRIESLEKQIAETPEGQSTAQVSEESRA
jgi:hypothetical protein